MFPTQDQISKSINTVKRPDIICKYVNGAKILAYNQRKTTRLFIEVAYSKINSNSTNRHVDIPPQYDHVIRNLLN